MKRTALTKNLMIIAVTLLVSIQSTHAQVDFSWSVEGVSKYIWRGFNLVDKPAIQPNLDFEFGETGFAVNVWNSFAVSDRDRFSGADELDFTVSFAPPAASDFGFSAGFIFYTFDFKADNNTKEFFAGVAPSYLPFSPELTVYYDFDAGDNLYATLAVTRSLPLGIQSLDFGATLGYNNGQFNTKSGISHIDLSVSTSFPAGGFNLSPRAVFVLVTESSVNPDNEFFIGLSLSR